MRGKQKLRENIKENANFEVKDTTRVALSFASGIIATDKRENKIIISLLSEPNLQEFDAINLLHLLADSSPAVSDLIFSPSHAIC